MSMWVQAYKDKASTLVKVVTLRVIREYNRFRCLNHRDELDRSTLYLDIDKNDRSLCFSHRDNLDSAVQISLGTCTIACMNAI